MFANLLIFNALDCGVRGIRTPEPLLTTTRFPDSLYFVRNLLINN